MRKTREIGRLPRQIRRSLIISGEGVGPCAVVQKASEESRGVLAETRKAKPNINGLPKVGRLWPLAMNFRGHWDALFRSMKVKKRFLSFPLRTVKPFRSAHHGFIGLEGFLSHSST